MILTTNEFLTSDASVKFGKSCRIKKISNKNLITAITQPIMIFNTPLNLGIYKPVKKFTKGKPAQANRPIKTL